MNMNHRKTMRISSLWICKLLSQLWKIDSKSSRIKRKNNWKNLSNSYHKTKYQKRSLINKDCPSRNGLNMKRAKFIQLRKTFGRVTVRLKVFWISSISTRNSKRKRSCSNWARANKVSYMRNLQRKETEKWWNVCHKHTLIAK